MKLLLAGALLSAMAHLWAEYRGPAWLIYVAKPLTTFLLLVLAFTANTPEHSYRALIVAGLLLSLLGDVFLMLPSDRFIAGLLSFLLAHCVYIAAFTTGARFGSHPLILLPYVALALVVLSVLWRRLGRMKAPVLVYVAALIVMAWQAAARAITISSPFTTAAAVGAALFVFSDGTLAIDRFYAKFRAKQALVMSTYVAAQALIALSVWRLAG